MEVTKYPISFEEVSCGNVSCKVHPYLFCESRVLTDGNGLARGEAICACHWTRLKQ